ncbi:MAG TPA: lysoplasmalogenase [Acidimicrobiia bacterium]
MSTSVSGSLGVVAWTCFASAVAFAALDWIAVATSRRSLEYVCKPGAALGFLATAIALHPVHADTRVWFCVALAWCTAGDVLLMLPRDAFVAGLASFLVAQLCFATGFALHVQRRDLAVGIALVVVIVVPLAGRFVRALRARGERALVPPVLVYVGAIAVMAATAIGTGIWLAMGGAGLFVVSDALIGETRFVRPRPWGPLAVIVTYHAALALLVASLTAT